MLKIGEFSKLSLLTVKTLRFYEKEGLLVPAHVDGWTGYRLYETAQPRQAALIKSYRQLGLSIEQIHGILRGADASEVLAQKAVELREQQSEIAQRLSIINHLLKERNVGYQVTVKEVPSYIVYSAQKRLANYSDMVSFIPQCGAECARLNPSLKCVEPHYEFCEYPEMEYRETDVLIRHNEAVTDFGVESDLIKFREIPACRVLSIYHAGPYDLIGDAYAFIMKYAEENGYTCAGLARECYIDGIWNKETPEEWLTEIQLPVE